MKFNLSDVKLIFTFLSDCGYSESEITSIWFGYFKFITGIDFTPVTWLNYVYDSPSVSSESDFDMTIRNNNLTIITYDLGLNSNHTWIHTIWFNNSIVSSLEYFVKDVNLVLHIWIKDNSFFDDSILDNYSMGYF
jgi:hypothetical protein